MSAIGNSEPAPARLLLVDDEVHIVASLRRLLRHEDYQIEVAPGGQQALDLLARERYDLVISDARMPGMDGATFLTLVQELWPDCMRILLTGYADISMTVKAINEGRIYRYISKPWDDDDLRMVIRQALQYQRSEQERKRLEQLSQQQNAHLQELNATLEQRVRDRTAELKQTADWLDLAYADLKRSYVTATQVFSSLLNLRIVKERQTNAQVLALLKAFCERHPPGEKIANDLAVAASLYNIGKLTWDDQLMGRPTDLLRESDKASYMQYPALGADLLMALDPLRDAAHIIRHHQERWDGAGFPERLREEEIPFGSRLLKLAVDFIELQTGIFLNRKLSRDSALQVLTTYAGRLYDPQLSLQFVDICRTLTPDLQLPASGVLALDTRHLEVGMVLARNLHSGSDILLLKEGKELSQELIDRLVAFERNEHATYVVMVYQKKEPRND